MSRSWKKKQPTKRGKPSVFPLEDWVLILLRFYREYPLYLSIACDMGVAASTIYRIVKKTEEVLLNSRAFALSGKKVLRRENHFEVIVVDATEIPVEHPKKRK